MSERVTGRRHRVRLTPKYPLPSESLSLVQKTIYHPQGTYRYDRNVRTGFGIGRCNDIQSQTYNYHQNYSVWYGANFLTVFAV